jgi:hypothetical protein
VLGIQPTSLQSSSPSIITISGSDKTFWIIIKKSALTRTYRSLESQA